jgi:hypothetical protein
VVISSYAVLPRLTAKVAAVLQKPFNGPEFACIIAPRTFIDGAGRAYLQVSEPHLRRAAACMGGVKGQAPGGYRRVAKVPTRR